LGLLSFRGSRATLNGIALKGIVKNTVVIAAGGGGGSGGSSSAGMDAVVGTSGTTLRNGSGTPGSLGSGATNGAGWLSNGVSLTTVEQLQIDL
jgi:hypothetical protein